MNHKVYVSLLCNSALPCQYLYVNSRGYLGGVSITSGTISLPMKMSPTNCVNLSSHCLILGPLAASLTLIPDIKELADMCCSCINICACLNNPVFHNINQIIVKFNLEFNLNQIVNHLRQWRHQHFLEHLHRVNEHFVIKRDTISYD